jgi:protein-tyrosine phosphatase
MPSTDKPANPFFGNIRQNMDLIGGVGLITLKHPSNETDAAEREYPEWLRRAADSRDQGKRVANKYEQIERREKKRMEDALSGKVSWGGTPKKQTPSGSSVQIAGIEKGNKNRYNNVWPFEHSRVKLQGVPSQGCDYVNASYVKAAWSHKHYISTQAPIPATFSVSAFS